MVASDGIIYLIDDHLALEDAGWLDDTDFTMVSYGLSEGSVELIEHPLWDVVDDYYYYFSIREYYDGSLSVYRRGLRTRHFEVWVLSRDKTWTMKHRFNLGLENNGDIQIFYFCKEDWAIYLNLNSRLVRCFYEDEQWRFEDVRACGDPCEPGIHIKPFTFSPWPISLPAVTL